MMNERLKKELLLSLKHFSEYNPQEWRDHVRKLYEEPEKTTKSDVTFTINARGTYIFTVRNRNPKYILPEELDAIAEREGISKREIWLAAGQKKNFIIKRESKNIRGKSNGQKTKGRRVSSDRVKTTGAKSSPPTTGTVKTCLP